MAEIEYGGIKVGGSKLLLVLPLIGTLGGGLWGGFEFYKDYMDMKEQIQNYVAPDLSEFDKNLAVLHEEMKITREALKNIVKETMIEESEYQEFFKRALEKAGKSIPSMSDEEKKAFFNKIEKTWKGRGAKKEQVSELTAAQKKLPPALQKAIEKKDSKKKD